MNVENMKRLVEHLESPDNPIRFRMNSYFSHNGCAVKGKVEILDVVEEHACGTVACLGGHAAYLAWKEGDKDYVRDIKSKDFVSDDLIDVYYTARRWLGLTGAQAYSMFLGRWSHKELHQITMEDAIDHLKSMIAQEVD